MELPCQFIKSLKAPKNVFIALLVSIISGCGGGGGGGGTSVNTSTPNIAPTVNAGPDQTANEGREVNLSGSGSDSDGSIVSYSWTQTNGPAVIADDMTSSSLVFHAPFVDADTKLSFELQVIDDRGAFVSDNIDVTVLNTNNLPTASAGDSIADIGGNIITLKCTGSGDVDGDTLTYQWQQTSGTPVHINQSTACISQFTAPINATNMSFNLGVSDGEYLVWDSVNVNITSYLGQSYSPQFNPIWSLSFTQRYINDTNIFRNGVTSSEIYDNYAFVMTAYAGIQIFDISKPDKPIFVGATDGSFLGSIIKVKDNLLYTNAPGIGIIVTDIGDLTNPVKLTTIKTELTVEENVTIAIAMVDSKAYVTSPSGFEIVDISTVEAPVILSGLSTGEDFKGAHRITIASNFAYVSTNDGFTIVDIADPTNPKVTGKMPIQGHAIAINVAGDFAYIASTGNGNHFNIVNISEPAAPVLVGSIDTPGNGRSVLVQGSLAYFSDESSGLQVIDVSNPASPVIVGNIKLTSYSISIKNNLAVNNSSYQEGLHIIDLSKATLPPILGSTEVVGGDHVEVVGDKAFTTGGGLSAVDISNLAEPTVLFAGYVGNYGVMDVVGDHIFKGDGVSPKFEIRDATIPSELPVIGMEFLSGNGAHDVEVQGDYAYVASNSLYFHGIDIIDISDKLSPKWTGSITGTNDAHFHSLTVNGDFLYLYANGFLQVWNVSVPANPVQVKAIKVNHVINYMTNTGSLLVTRSNTGIEIFDISEPDNPTLLSQLPSGFYKPFISLTIIGDRIYVANGVEGIKVISISNPANPQYIGHLDTLGDATHTAVVGNNIFVTETNTLFYNFAGNALTIYNIPSVEIHSASSNSEGNATYNYDISWPESRANTVLCKVTAGECHVTKDIPNKTARLTWTIPEAPGHYEIQAIVGNSGYFATKRHRIIVN